MALRLLRAYAVTLVLLALASMLLTASTALGAALHRSGADLLVLLPLAVVGVVAVSVLALDLAWRRRTDLELARLRGVRGTAALRVAAGPAVGAAVVGGVLGLGASAVLSAVPPPGWSLPGRPGAAEVGWGLGAAVVVGLVAATACLAVLRRPLAPTSTVTGPQPVVPPTLVAVGGVGLVVVSVVSLYRAEQPAAGSSALVLAASAVLGLTWGQVLVWVVRALPVGEGRSTAYVLAVRRLASRRHGARLRLVVAASVVVVATWSGASAAGSWAREADQLRVGAPLQVALPDTSALDVWRLTRDLDPDGRWLMAGAVLDDRPDAALRAAYLDLSRYDRVSGDTLASTPGDLTGVLAPLQDVVPVEVVTGTRLSVAATYEPGSDEATPRRAVLSLAYLSDAGVVQPVDVRLRRGGREDASLVGATEAPACEQACVLLSVAATASGPGSGVGAGRPGRVVLDELSLEGADLVPDGLVDDRDAGAPPARALVLDRSYLPLAARAPLPVLVAGDPTWPAEGPRAPGIGGTARPLTEVGARAALPLVVGAGVVGDLPAALAATRGSVTGVRSVVLAREDTPAAVMAALTDAGAEPPVTTATQGDAALGAAAGGERHLRQVVAVGATGLALLCLVGAAAGMSDDARRDQAALSLVGVTAGTRRRAAIVEAGLVCAGTLVATALGSLLVVRTVTGAAALTPTGATLLPPPQAYDGSRVLVVAVAAAGAWLLLVVTTRRDHSTRAPR